MKKLRMIFIYTSLVGAMACTASQVGNTLSTIGTTMASDETTESDVISGLKEALINGVTKGSNEVSSVDGFFKDAAIKLLVPPELQKVEKKLRDLGMNKLMDDFTLSMNRAAEDASKEAKPIFVSAIKGMTVKDAWNILKGEKNAATTYLKGATSDELYAAFKPKVKASLDKVNATKYYEDVVNTYNKIPFVEKVNADLPDYATNKAIDGIFTKVEKEEANIRENPAARTTDLLKKVFTPKNMGQE